MPSLRHLEAARLAIVGAGERALFVAEDFRFEERVGQRGAVECLELPLTPARQVVDHPRDELFARSGGPEDQHRDVGLGGGPNPLEDDEHFLVAADHLAEAAHAGRLVFVRDRGAALEERGDERRDVARRRLAEGEARRVAGDAPREPEVDELADAVLDVETQAAERGHQRFGVERVVRTRRQEPAAVRRAAATAPVSGIGPRCRPALRKSPHPGVSARVPFQNRGWGVGTVPGNRSCQFAVIHSARAPSFARRPRWPQGSLPFRKTHQVLPAARQRRHQGARGRRVPGVQRGAALRGLPHLRGQDAGARERHDHRPDRRRRADARGPRRLRHRADGARADRLRDQHRRQPLSRPPLRAELHAAPRLAVPRRSRAVRRGRDSHLRRPLPGIGAARNRQLRPRLPRAVGPRRSRSPRRISTSRWARTC